MFKSLKFSHNDTQSILMVGEEKVIGHRTHSNGFTKAGWLVGALTVSAVSLIS
jgi:hypothetical protein